MPSKEEIEKAKALLEQEGFSVRQTTDDDWKRFGAVITCNMIAPGLKEKKFVDMIDSALRVIFASKLSLSRALNNEVAQMGPLNVKSYTRVKVGLQRKGETIAE